MYRFEKNLILLNEKAKQDVENYAFFGVKRITKKFMFIEMIEKKGIIVLWFKIRQVKNFHSIS